MIQSGGTMEYYYDEEEQYKENKKAFRKGALSGALVMLCICLGISGGIVYAVFGGNSVISLDLIAKLSVIQAYVEDNYFYDIDYAALEEGVYQGYMDALGDPYSVYYTAEETTDILESSSGEYSGIGVVISQDLTTGIVTLTSIFDDSPAEAAGLQEGDILEAVDGVDMTGEDVTNISTAVKGPEGTTVDITIYRSSSDESLTYTVTRATIEYDTVAYSMLEDQVGYIYVSEFDTVTLAQFEEALVELENQGMEALIIDVRNNPGGNLDTVCSMLELLLPEGLIVYTEDRDGNIEEYYGEGDGEFSLPLAVLVNEYSASASEIFAIAIQDYEVGEVVGVTTYGKGIVQRLWTLPDDTMIKMTISEYFSPLGNSIHGIGVIPDIEVEYDLDDLETDEQLNAAIETVID